MRDGARELFNNEMDFQRVVGTGDTKNEEEKRARDVAMITALDYSGEYVGLCM